ncbi:hypothetical protein RclHR1_00660015 [Rhizophagus clarus]|uniref:Uncharacterized protein n=1 Tax=Rhizophagus clarus TaxID=94130 RepID=A0A2Z6RU99_9GLOM|nr:hypothetical protein RclHR1_25820001 [Rhizophagus clarus]GBC06061.1 hypothetical protein RclHR1_00660015 [Rhizophagus clarus]GES73878.1 hypothetical protein GLOIN_2v1844017 [Rhizophagus clarus]
MSNKLLFLQKNGFTFYHYIPVYNSFYLINCKKISQDFDSLNDYCEHGFFYERLNNSVSEVYYIMCRSIPHEAIVKILNNIEIHVSTLERKSLDMNQKFNIERELKRSVLPSELMKYHNFLEKEERTDYSGSVNSYNQSPDATLVITNPTPFVHHQNGVGNFTCDVNNNRQHQDNFPQNISDHHLHHQVPQQHTPEGIPANLIPENNGMDTVDYNNYGDHAIGSYNHHHQQIDSNISNYTRREEFPSSDEYISTNENYPQQQFHENNESTNTSRDCSYYLPPNDNNDVQTSHSQVDRNDIPREIRPTYENNEASYRVGVENYIYSPQQHNNNFPHHDYIDYIPSE